MLEIEPVVMFVWLLICLFRVVTGVLRQKEAERRWQEELRKQENERKYEEEFRRRAKEERAKKRAAGSEEHRPQPAGTVTQSEACELLGVSQGCTLQELIRAYHKKVSEWHPDKLDTMAQELRDYATRRTARINEAYQRLRSSRL